MLGLDSLEAALAIWLCLAAALLCVVYGAVNWNKRGRPDTVREERTVVRHRPESGPTGGKRNNRERDGSGT
jgi:hypothetical protein